MAGLYAVHFPYPVRPHCGQVHAKIRLGDVVSLRRLDGQPRLHKTPLRAVIGEFPLPIVIGERNAHVQDIVAPELLGYLPPHGHHAPGDLRPQARRPEPDENLPPVVPARRIGSPEELPGRRDPLFVLHADLVRLGRGRRIERDPEPVEPLCALLLGAEREILHFLGVAQKILQAVVLLELVGGEPRDEPLLSGEGMQMDSGGEQDAGEDCEYENRGLHFSIEKSSDLVAERKLRRSVTVTVKRNGPSERFSGAIEMCWGWVAP